MSRKESVAGVKNTIVPLKRTSEEPRKMSNDFAMVRSCSFLYISHGSSFYWSTPKIVTSACHATLRDFKQTLDCIARSEKWQEARDW